MTGRVHSFQSLGTLDGPGVRFVVFMQGCHLRCGCCHNPDTWDVCGGTEYTPEDILQKALRFREYFGADGGITVSGGEPLLQAAFVTDLFGLCHNEGVHTCLDTSGSIPLNGNSQLSYDISQLLHETDHVLLDIKYTEDTLYQKHVGCSLSTPMSFLTALEERKIPTTLRQVIIPGLNDSEDAAYALKAIADRHSCVEKVELLPFRKICQTKYDVLGQTFPFGHIPEPAPDVMKKLECIVR